MAKRLKAYEFKRMGSKGSAYDQYLDGNIWMLTLEDAPNGGTSIRGMQSNIAGAGRRKGLKVRTQIERDYEFNEDTGEQEIVDERLIVQAIPDIEEETE